LAKKDWSPARELATVSLFGWCLKNCSGLRVGYRLRGGPSWTNALCLKTLPRTVAVIGVSVKRLCFH